MPQSLSPSQNLNRLKLTQQSQKLQHQSRSLNPAQRFRDYDRDKRINLKPQLPKFNIQQITQKLKTFLKLIPSLKKYRSITNKEWSIIRTFTKISKLINFMTVKRITKTFSNGKLKNQRKWNNWKAIGFIKRDLNK